MRKRIIPLLAFTLLVSLCGCRSNSKEKPYQLDTLKDIDSFIYFDSNDLINKISKKDDFVLVIGQEGCESCETIKPLLKQYINKYHVPFYWIETSEYKKASNLLDDDSTYSLRKIITSASLMLFNDGIDNDYIEYESKLYSKYQTLEKKLNHYISLSGYNIVNDFEEYNYGVETMYRFNYLNTKQLDKIIASENEETILFSWDSCPDCISLKERFLDQYLIENDKTINIFEVDEIRNHEDEKVWEQFKKKYQFDNYRSGRVPSFVTYKSSLKIDMAVFQNDVIEEKDNSYVVTESFWNEEIKSMKSDSLEKIKDQVAKKEIELIRDYLNSHI